MLVYTATHCRYCDVDCVEFVNDGIDICVTCKHPQFKHEKPVARISAPSATAPAVTSLAQRPAQPRADSASAHPGSFVSASAPASLTSPAALSGMLRQAGSQIFGSPLPSGSEPDSAAFLATRPQPQALHLALPSEPASEVALDNYSGPEHLRPKSANKRKADKIPRGFSADGYEEHVPAPKTFDGLLNHLATGGNLTASARKSVDKSAEAKIEFIYTPETREMPVPTAKELNELRHAGYSVAITVPKKAGQAMTLARFALACGPLRMFWRDWLKSKDEKLPADLSDSYVPPFRTRKLHNKTIEAATEQLSFHYDPPYTMANLFKIKSSRSQTTMVVFSPNPGLRHIATTQFALYHWPSRHWGDSEPGMPEMPYADLIRISTLVETHATSFPERAIFEVTDDEDEKPTSPSRDDTIGSPAGSSSTKLQEEGDYYGGEQEEFIPPARDAVSRHLSPPLERNVRPRTSASASPQPPRPFDEDAPLAQQTSRPISASLSAPTAVAEPGPSTRPRPRPYFGPAVVERPSNEQGLSVGRQSIVSQCGSAAARRAAEGLHPPRNGPTSVVIDLTSEEDAVVPAAEGEAAPVTVKVEREDETPLVLTASDIEALSPASDGSIGSLPDLDLEDDDAPLADLLPPPRVPLQHVQAIPTSLCHQSSWQVQMLVHAEQALDLSPAVCREGGNYLQFSSTSTKVEDRVLEATSWIEERFLKVNEEGWPAGISMGWTTDNGDSTAGTGPARLLLTLVAEELVQPKDARTLFVPAMNGSQGCGLGASVAKHLLGMYQHRIKLLGFVLSLCIQVLDFLPAVISPALFALLVDPEYKFAPIDLAFDPGLAGLVERLTFVFQEIQEDEIESYDFSAIKHLHRIMPCLDSGFAGGNEAARRDQINAFMRYHKADSIQMLVSASLSGVLVHDAKHLGYVADLLDSCGLMRFVRRRTPTRFMLAYAFQTVLPTKEQFGPGRVEYEFQLWPGHFESETIKINVRRAVTTLTPLQALAVFRYITGLQFVPSDAKITFVIRDTLSVQPMVHACLSSVDISPSMIWDDYLSDERALIDADQFGAILLNMILPGYQDAVPDRIRLAPKIKPRTTVPRMDTNFTAI